MRFRGTRLLSAALCALAVLAVPLRALTQTPAFKLPDSDLRLCWDTAGTPVSCAGTGQDGDYAADSPTANGLSYTISSDTVFDNNTGLTWQRGGDGQTYTWEAAKAACTSLNLGGFSTGWRLPSKKELAGIIDYAIPAPGPVFPSAFTNSFANYYWTSTPLADGSGLYAWGAYIPWGNVAAASKSITPMYVRCVRGNEYGNVTGTAPVRPELVVNQNRTVTDTRTGLTWQRDESGTRTWDQALDYCNTLAVAGLEWRLPNIKELESLIDDTKYAPAVDPTAFPNAVQWLYWSSTSYPAVPSALWRIDLTSGYIDGYYKNGAAINVKCVSGPDSTHLLTVQSTYPAAGVAIAVTPADHNGNGNGSTTFTRSYAPGALVTLTAPATADGNAFAGWTGCGSVSGSGNTICSVTMNAAKTVTAKYTRDALARPMASALWSRSDDGRAAIWKVDPATGMLQQAVKLNSGVGVGAPWLATSYQQVDATTGYVLWSRSDTGQAVLWKIDPATGARTGLVNLGSSVGAPWQATSYAHAGASAAYVLWTRSDTGQAVLWKVDPATGARLSIVTLGASAGVGAPWRATSYVHAGPTTGYVLWTRADTGQAVLWTVDPGTGARTRLASVTPAANASWLAAGYEQTSDTSGQVLWTRSDTGAAVLWAIDPSAASPSKTSTIWLYDGTTPSYPAELVGGPWQATAYVPVNDAPTVDAVENRTVDPDGLLTVAVDGIGSGDPGQSVSVTAFSSNPALVPDPSVSYTSPSATAYLTFTPVPGAFGTATITVWISDGQAANSPVSTSFTITFNDPPTDVALSSRLADAGLPAGTAVGTLQTTDPNAGDTFTYSLVSGSGGTDNASFALAGAGGSQLVTDAVLDYTGRPSYSIRVRSTDRAGGWTERVLTIVPPAYTLWTRSDTGQAQLWQVDPDTGARGSSVSLGPSAGVGAPWQATSFAKVDGATGYVLWSRSDTGQSVLWKVNPGTGAWLRTVSIGASSGVGAPWLATSFELADAVTGYVLWTRSDTGQAVVNRLDLTNFDTVSSLQRGKPRSIHSSSGSGARWQATSLVLADPVTGYVLWTRSDNGRGVLWRVDFTDYDTLDVLPVDDWANLRSSTGIGAPWVAAGYEQTAPDEGYVLWTRSDLGQGYLWTVDPSVLPATIQQVAPLQKLHTGTGLGTPWQATSYVRP